MSRASKDAKKERKAEKRKTEQDIARGCDPIKMKELRDRLNARREGKAEKEKFF